jgi:hypothetical protein
MGNIKLHNGKIVPDRRINGSRIKLDIADWVKISITIFTTFAIIVFGAGKLLAIVNNHSEIIAKQEKQININTQRLCNTESDITNIKENLIYIRDKIDTLVLTIKK